MLMLLLLVLQFPALEIQTKHQNTTQKIDIFWQADNVLLARNFLCTVNIDMILCHALV